MSTIEHHLGRWQHAGLLDAANVASILGWESKQAREPASERPSLIEALTYLGLAIVLLGITVLVGSNWDQVQLPLRVAIPAVPGVLAVVAGALLLRADRADLRRGGRMAWLLAVALAGAVAGVLGDEVGFAGEDIPLAIGLAALAAAVALATLERGGPQVVSLLGGMTMVAIGLGAEVARVDERYAMLAVGLTLAAGSALAVAAAETGVLRPTAIARGLGGFGLGLGGFLASTDGHSLDTWSEFIVFPVAVLLIVLSLRREVFIYLAVGIAAAFLGIFTLVLRHVDDPTAMGLALIAIGMVLVASVIAIARLRPWQRRRHAAAAA